jgi:hypothetical protein
VNVTHQCSVATPTLENQKMMTFADATYLMPAKSAL